MRESTLFKHLTSSSIVTACCVLGLLYFGRDVLEPLALAVILSLVIAPLIRSLRRIGLGQMPATMLSVLMVGTCVVGLGIVLAFQLVAVTGDLPKYRAAIRTKVAAVRELTESGADIRGFTWWPLFDFVDWSYASGGRNVEEFVLDEALVAARSHSGSAKTPYLRRMGLVRLEEQPDGSLLRVPTAAAEAFARHARASADPEQEAG